MKQKEAGVSTNQKSIRTFSVDHSKLSNEMSSGSAGSGGSGSSNKQIGSTLQSKILNKLRHRNRELIQQLNPHYFELYQK